MQKLAPKPAQIAIIVVFALSCLAALLFLWRSFGGPTPLAPTGYRFHILVPNAGELAPNADVRIAGINVGKVVELRRRGMLTDAELELSPPYAPLPMTTRAILRLKTLLGETYVQLAPGRRGGPKIPDGGTLPASHVAHNVQIDEVLRSLDARTRADLRTVVQSSAATFAGRSQNVSNALGNLPGLAQDGNGVLSVLDAEHAALTRLVRDSGTVFAAIGDREADVRTLISSGDRLFRATAARNHALAATVASLPPLLGRLRPALAEAQATAVDLGPTVHALRPVAPLLRPSLQDVAAFAPDLEVTFRELDPVIRLGRTALPAARSLLLGARPLLAQLWPAGRELVPVAYFLDLYKRELITSWAKAAAAAQATAPNPEGGPPLHYLRVLSPLAPEDVATWQKRPGTNRHNPYLAPGGLDKLPTGLDSFDCQNTGNPTVPGTQAPPCHAQQPLDFQGTRHAYPRLEPDPP